MSDFSLLLETASFAATAHAGQKRKNQAGTPYINHPLDVCRRLAAESSSLYPNPPIEILQAALLHDVVEDTPYTADDIAERFGNTVKKIVLECSDDPNLGKAQRKQKQIDSAPHKSIEAKHVKLSDKLANLSDLTRDVPVGWTAHRVQDYFCWAKKVSDAVGTDVNPGLSEQLDELYRSAWFEHQGKKYKCHPTYGIDSSEAKQNGNGEP